MIKATILPNGNLKLSASNEVRRFIKENENNSYWRTMAELFEGYACNGSFDHFDSGQANPFIGLTSAPAVAEVMNTDDEGNHTIDGRCWAFMDYMVRDDLEELKRKGFVIYQLVR